MRTLRLFNRWNRGSTLAVPSSLLRVEVRPPSLCHAPDSTWQRLMFWLMATAPQDASPPLNRLPGVRDEFTVALADVDSFDAEVLRERIALARSLRELWHLRADVYRAVSLQHSQSLAEERLAELNRHFPTRAPRSAFAPL
ncbi:MAG: hypothetical protein WAQ05_23915 [Rubrivivax sp.]